jgi:hypothetical protein
MQLELSRRFQHVLELGATTGDWSLVYPSLAADVEWITPQRRTKTPRSTKPAPTATAIRMYQRVFVDVVVAVGTLSW